MAYVGQRIARKEDERFITGKGRYTDDIVLPGQTFAVFVRSPLAHAKVNGIDSSRAAAMAGVLGVFTGADLEQDSVGGVPCGWQITNKDGST
ncbi:MAG: xanthine dehydrogenase family protein molybdopterin-binding subunit, partial [Myxococcota bacterium]